MTPSNTWHDCINVDILAEQSAASDKYPSETSQINVVSGYAISLIVLDEDLGWPRNLKCLQPSASSSTEPYPINPGLAKRVLQWQPS